MPKKYMLITVIDREILTELFYTLEEAQATMHNEMVEFGRVSPMVFDDRTEEYDDGECGFGKYNAYANDGVNHDDCDWLIVELNDGGRK